MPRYDTSTYSDGMATLARAIESLRPIYADVDYYVRLFTGLLATCYVFVICAITSIVTYDNYDGFVRTEGNTSYYSSVEELGGSKGQVFFAVIVAAVALIAAISVAFGKLDVSALERTKLFFQVAGLLLVPVAFLGGLGIGAIQFLLLGDLLGARQLFWIFLPLFLVAGVWGSAAYAKEGTSTIIDELT